MNEKEYLDKIEIFLKENGFKTWREVIPDQCINWKEPYRVDLIFWGEEIGYTACEAKYFNSLRQGAKIAQTIEQIKKYNKLTYLKGIVIERWCLILGNHYDSISMSNSVIKTENDGIKSFLRPFLIYYGLNFLEYYENKHNPRWNKITINKNNKGSIFIKKEETI